MLLKGTVREPAKGENRSERESEERKEEVDGAGRKGGRGQV